MQLSEEDRASYWCHAVFQLGESKIPIVVLSYLVPLKPFLAIVAEVILSVAITLLCEMYTPKNKNHPDDEKEFEQIEQLKSDNSSNGIENNALLDPGFGKLVSLQ
nr:LOW QUALITY PROTEIN: embigin-like [Loxodonta africana]